jgi:hypothetical protein
MIIVTKSKGKFTYHGVGYHACQFLKTVSHESLLPTAKEVWKLGQVDLYFLGRCIPVHAELNRQLALVK